MPNHPDADQLRAMALRFREGRMSARERAICGVALTLLALDLDEYEHATVRNMAIDRSRRWLPDDIRVPLPGEADPHVLTDNAALRTPAKLRGEG